MRLLRLVFVTLLLGQPPVPYGSDWVADFQGTTYVRLALRDGVGAPQSAMSICDSIHVDKQGNVDQVTEAPSTLRPIFDVRWNRDVLSFSFGNGGNNVDRFELRLIDSNTAELSLLLSEEDRQELLADGVPLPKPFRLARSR